MIGKYVNDLIINVKKNHLKMMFENYFFLFCRVLHSSPWKVRKRKRENKVNVKKFLSNCHVKRMCTKKWRRTELKLYLLEKKYK